MIILSKGILTHDKFKFSFENLHQNSIHKFKNKLGLFRDSENLKAKLAKLEVLLKSGANVNHANSHNETALTYAISKGT